MTSSGFEDLPESGVIIPNVIPTFPIPIDLDYNQSFYSVNVSFRTDIFTGCSSGFICNKTHQASCSEIRQVANTTFGYGDIHGGSYCPQGVAYYLNCPLGHYCPDPETLLPCPAGFYCPHKTAVPAIVCNRCPEGSEVLVRDTFGIVLIILFMVVVTVYLASFFFQQRVERLKVKFESLSSRVVQKSDLERRLHQRKARLDRVRPKLEILNRRLQIHGLHDESILPTLMVESSQDMHGSAALNSSAIELAPVYVSPEGEVSFNAEEFFNVIDRDENGVLSYEELNTVLQFDELELNEFCRRMNRFNEVSAPTDLNHVTKPTFVQYFLDVLDETSNFRLTPEEAGLRWDDAFAANGSDSKGNLQLDVLYESSIAQFLTDVQIKDIILGLRKAKMSSPSQDGPSFFVSGSDGISRDLFCKHYPMLLEAILADASGQQSQCGDSNRKDGIDIAFQHLQLAVKVGRDKYINVVDDVTGRIQKGTMTALLGGSGAGKTSLLNALCGRAYYGEVKGDVYINGNPASTEDFSDSIGFVPQDDIVFAELTVRENLIYSGRFRLPKGTPLYEIEDLADTVLANLGLSRKANSIVGDVTRRGVSGGEKKRVNIGLELMARPTALFLDEPTSGLDASSALLVMKSLEQLVRNQGVTVCSVIHQPRKFIFELFDSLLLLGVGGRMVYHGTVEDANPYFTSLGYTLPPGESLADWLIDISTGRIAADEPQEQADEECGENAPLLQRQASRGLALKKVSMTSRFTNLSVRAGGARSEGTTSADGSEVLSDILDEPTRLDTQVVTAAGPSSNMQQTAESAAKIRRELLYASWSDHFEHVDDESRKKYDPPTPYEPPRSTLMPSFGVQFMLQMQRTVLLAWRNRVTKTIETAIIVIAVAIISYFEGTASLTKESVPLIPFEAFIAGQEEVIVAFFQPLFEFSLKGSVGYLRYGVSVGVIASVLIALTSVKAITDKRLEFYREAGSGYNINSYFLAVNVFTSFDQGGQVLFAAVIAQWLLDSISNKAVFYLAFLLLAWISISWALLIPLITPPKNTLVMLGFFMAFFGLLFGGTTPPVEYKDMYADNGTAKALFAAFFSPPRFFTETIAVSDLKCLPPQTGFTQTDETYNFPEGKDSFAWGSLGQNDSNVTDLSTNGWYWNLLPGFLVGLTIRVLAFGAINSLNRAQMAKKSFLFQLRNKGSSSLYLSVAAFWLFLGGLIGVTCWMILRVV